jgi:hypothetical protein
MLVSILQQSDDFGPLIHVLRRLRVARDEFERIGWYWRLGKFLESSHASRHLGRCGNLQQNRPYYNCVKVSKHGNLQ